MKYLLDTHIILWALMNRSELSERARNIINDRHNQLYYSTVSVWEVAIKHRLHPERISCSSTELLGYLDASILNNIAVQNHHILALERLHRVEGAPRHEDPFDRILIAQAIAEDAVFLTHDRMFCYYDDVRINVV